MKKSYLLLVLAMIWSSCKQSQDVNPVQTPAEVLIETNTPTTGVNFSNVYLAARSSINSLTISSRVTFDKGQVTIREFGYCLSETDSLPQLTNPSHRRLVAPAAAPGSYGETNITIPNLTPGKTYFIDPYVILKNGLILYGRHNTTEPLKTNVPSATAFQLPKRPAVLPVQLVRRADVPTLGIAQPVGIQAVPDPHFHNFVTLRGRLYSFYPTGDLVAYDATADRWEPMAALGTSVFGTSPIVFPAGDKLYVHSSPNYWYGADRPTPNVWEYDPEQNKWTDLGKQVGVNLFNSFYQLSTNGKAYFINEYPYTVLAFDAQRKQTSVVEKPVLRTNRQYYPYLSTGNGLYYGYALDVSSVTTNTIKTYVARYDLTNDRLTEDADLTPVLHQQPYTDTGIFTAIGQDLLIGYGARSNILVNPGRLKAIGTVVRDELLRYATGSRQITGYYDLSGLSNSPSYFPRPLTIGNRLFIFDSSTSTGLFTEVIFP